MIQAYCLFYKNNDLVLGYIREHRKENRSMVVPHSGKELLVPHSQIELKWPAEGSLELSQITYLLANNQSRIEDKIGQIDLDTIWELCEPENKQIFSIDELAEIHGGTDWDKAALLLALKRTPRLFKAKKKEFMPRTSEEIEEFDRQQEKIKLEALRHLRHAYWASQLRKGSLPDIPENEMPLWEELVQRIKNVMLTRRLTAEWKPMEELLGFNIEEDLECDYKFIELMRTMQTPVSWGRLSIAKVGVSPDFPETINMLAGHIVEEAGRITLPEPESATCFTIDSASTRDYDDALSIELKDCGGSIIRTYITNVADYITPGTVIWHESERRISSLYTPLGTYPMLPQVLSENLLSLKAGAPKKALAFEWELDADGGIVSSGIRECVVHVAKNLTYKEADQLIKSSTSKEWNTLWLFAQSLKAKRLAHGALDLMRYDVKLDVSDPASIKIEVEEEKTPANVLIEELAVASNCMAAEYMSERQAACLYRSQSPYKISAAAKARQENSENDQGEASDTFNGQAVPVTTKTDVAEPVNGGATPPHTEKAQQHSAEDDDKSMQLTLSDVHIRSAVVSLEPAPHSGLGVDKYMQVTSPIRRFQDLLNQSLLLGMMRGSEPWFEENTMLNWAKNVEEQTKELQKLERSLILHWKYKYLAQNIGLVIDGELQRMIKPGLALISFPKLDMVHIQATPEPSKQFKARIEEVDTKLHRLRITIIDSALPETPANSVEQTL